MLKAEGVIQKITEVQQVSEKFKKRTFVLTVGDQYPQPVEFQLSQDKTELIDNFAEGEKVSVSFNLRGKEWINPQGEAKYFTTLDAWKIESNEN